MTRVDVGWRHLVVMGATLVSEGWRHLVVMGATLVDEGGRASGGDAAAGDEHRPHSRV